MIPSARILQRLIDAKLEFVLVGGLAALVHGSNVVTSDVDICMQMTDENLQRLDSALHDLHPKHRMTPDKLEFAFEDVRRRGVKNLYLTTDWGVLDCIGEVLGLGDYQEAIKWSQNAALPFGTCRILTLDGIIKAKEAAGRPHDLQAVWQLRAIQSKKAGDI